MDDLTQCLYDFLLECRMGSLRENKEYRACLSAVELQEEQVKSFLNGEQRKELELLLDRVAERDSIEQTHLFQAVLELVRELGALVR